MGGCLDLSVFGCCIPITAWVLYVGVTAGIIFSAVIKTNGFFAGKIVVADVSNADPGIGGATSRFGYSVVWVTNIG